MLSKGINDLFPTKAYLGEIQDRELQSQVINEVFTNDELLNTSSLDNYGTLFHNDNSILERFRKEIVIPAFDTYLKQTIDQSLDNFDYKLGSWITGRGNNYSMIRHNHQGSYLSAVFYLLAETRGQGGEIVFHDPRSNANRGYTQEFDRWFDNVSHEPATGEYLVFPSFLYHYVNTFKGSNRIALVVDLFLYQER